MRRIIFSVFSLFISLSAMASDWKSHFSYETDVTEVERIGQLVYGMSDKKLYSYNTLTQEFSTPIKEEYNTAILKIAKDEKSEKLLIIREGLDINIFNGETFKSIPFLRETNLNLDKTANSISFADGMAYISTAFGLVIVDMELEEIKEICFFLFPVYSVTKHDNYLYAATSKGVYRILPEKNIQDFANWESFPLDEKYSATDTSFEDESIRTLVSFNDRLYLMVPDRSFYYLDGGEVIRDSQIWETPRQFYVKDNKMFVVGESKLWIYAGDSFAPSTMNISSLMCIADDETESEFWVGIKGEYLAKIKKTGESYSFVNQNLRPNGPLSNHPFETTFAGGQISVVGGGYLLNYFNLPGQLSRFVDGSWVNYATPSAAHDYVAVEANPANPDNLFVPAWGQGIFEFNGETFVKAHNQKNSSLMDIFGKSGFVRVDGLKFEGPDKFWVCATMVSKVINVFWKKDGIWKSLGYSHPEIYFPDNVTNSAVVTDLLVDSRGNKWVVSMANTYIFIFNESGTIEDISDDKTRHISDFYDQEGNTIRPSRIRAIKEDADGNIWVVTERGVFIINRLDDVFTDKIVLRKIEFGGDGADSSDNYLLGQAEAGNIAIDKANRKWIATEDKGVYLIDAKNLSVLAHFTKDNSPLPSNRAISLAIDDNGHVFMGTDKGLVEYSGEFITSQSVKQAEVYAYPNPITREFARNLVIKGLKGGSLVKIIDADNNLVNSGFASKDGSFEWNGINTVGDKVVPAAYYLLGTGSDDSEGILTTLRVVN